MGGGGENESQDMSVLGWLLAALLRTPSIMVDRNSVSNPCWRATLMGAVRSPAQTTKSDLRPNHQVDVYNSLRKL